MNRNGPDQSSRTNQVLWTNTISFNIWELWYIYNMIVMRSFIIWELRYYLSHDTIRFIRWELRYHEGLISWSYFIGCELWYYDISVLFYWTGVMIPWYYFIGWEYDIIRKLQHYGLYERMVVMVSYNPQNHSSMKVGGSPPLTSASFMVHLAALRQPWQSLNPRVLVHVLFVFCPTHPPRA